MNRIEKFFRYGISGILNGVQAVPHLEIHLRTAPSTDGRFSFDVPVARCRNIIQQQFTGNSNPFVSAARALIRDNVNEAEHILLTYYETNKPDSLFSCFLYSRDLAGSGEYNSRSQPPSLIMPPWDSMRRRDVQKLRRKTVVHPLIGPQATEAVRSQIKRYLSVYRSIKQHDYQPNVFGHIQGYVLDRGDDAVFVATSGKHRIAVLAALGWERIPVTFKPNMPPCFCLCQSHYWPNVVNGLYSVEEAEMIFNGYFAS